MIRVAIYFGLLTFNIFAIDPSRWSKDIVEPGCLRSDTFLYCVRDAPRTLPFNVTHLYLKNGIQIFYRPLVGENWKNLKVLHIVESSKKTNIVMKNLESLEELYISFKFALTFPKIYAGLENLKILSLSGFPPGISASLQNHHFTVAERKNNYTNLEAFSVKYTYLSFFLFAETPLEAIVNKTSKSLDMNFVKAYQFKFIEFLCFAKCSERINISYSTGYYNTIFGHRRLTYQEFFKPEYENIEFSFHFGRNVSGFTRSLNRSLGVLKVLDASYISFAFVNDYVQYVLELKNKTITLPLEIVTIVSRAEIVNISGINQLRSTIKLQSLSVNMVQYFSQKSPTRELIVRNNRLQYLDVTFHCNESNLERLDLSSNDIEFIQPNMCSCCTRLIEINLSKNNLFKMANRNYSLFGQLISSYKKLKHVQLSFNKLTEIPKEMFHETTELEQIDLSNNVLTKITFNLGHILNLKSLNLKHNRILMFDRTSLCNLELMNEPNFSPNKRFGILKLDNNPILCSECKFLPSINWLATTPLIDRNGNNIFCKNHEELYIHADENAVQKLQEECDKPKWIRNVIILSSVIPIATTALMVISICTCLRWRRQRLRKRNIEEKIELIRLNQLNTRFVVFLSYSSEDTDFLNEYVYYPLKLHLQEKLQTERDIICLGDRHFQLGKPVNDEMVRSLQQSAVVLLLLSRNFCRSEFCRMEFDHALFMKKPFIVMVKGEVDINEMVPSLQEIFRRNTRLLWERDGDTFLMKTSWDNVSSSILELI